MKAAGRRKKNNDKRSRYRGRIKTGGTSWKEARAKKRKEKHEHEEERQEKKCEKE